MVRADQNDWGPRGVKDFAWFLWEPENPPERRRWYHVLLSDGEEMSAMFQDNGHWWSMLHGRIEPMLWRDAPYIPNSEMLGTQAEDRWGS